jgi:DNA-binding transcriptional MerR regulator
MESAPHIGEAARRLGITREHLRNLERTGRIPKPRRDYNGRVYSDFDLALLKALGVGDRSQRLKRIGEGLGAAHE